MSIDLLNKDSLDSKLVVEKINYDTDKVVIKGAEHQLKEVVEVKALVDLNNLTANTAGTYTIKDVPLKAYTKDGEVVDVEIVPETIDVEVQIASPSKELPIKLVPVGDVASGYAISSMTSSETKVTVYGDSETLNNLKSIPVNVDVSGLKEGKTYKLQLEKPVGVKSLSINNITVTVGIGNVSNKKIDGVKISVKNLSDEYKATPVTESDAEVTVNLKGVQSVINGITADDVTPYVDLTGYEPGNYEVEVKIEGTDSKVQYTSMTKKVKIKISKK